MLRLNLFWAMGYFLGGYLGTLIAIPPSYASCIWPAAGVALAAVFTHGKRVIPGIWLGALITQIYAFLDTSHLHNIPTSLLIGIIASIAATAQAGLGSWLIKRHIGANNALVDDRSIWHFFALGAPLSCILAATIGVATLYFESLVTLDNLAFSWLTWWVGDVIGVLIFTPLLLCFMGRPSNLWRLRVNSVALPLLVLSLLVAVLFQLGKSQEQARISAIFEERTKLLHNALQNEVNVHIEINHTLKAYFDGSVEVTPAEFEQFTQHIFAAHKTLLALEWIPRITRQNRAYYEHILGSGFAIRIPDANYNMVTAPTRDEAFPIAYLQPWVGNERAFGFDVSANKLAFEALQFATDTGETTVTEILHLVQDPQHRSGIVLYSPVYRNHQPLHTLELRRQHLQGFVASVLRVGDEVSQVKKHFAALQIQVKITDQNTVLFDDVTQPPRLMLGYPPLAKTTQLPFANRVWNVRYNAAPQFYATQISWHIWWLILGGFLLTGLTGLGLLMLTGRTMRTEGIVKLRTQELENEVASRKKIIRQRNNHNKVLQAIASPRPLIEILELIVKIAESNYSDSYCTILLLDETGKYFHLGVAPSLPSAYSQAINGLAIGDGVGSCGTAAYTGKRVIIEDVFKHPYCKDFVGLAKAFNLGACWSEPIFSSNHQVLGTLAVYHPTPYCPNDELLAEVSELAQLASIAIERRRSEEKVTQLAFFDALTNLPNRRMFMATLEKALSSDIRHKTKGALVYMDLDHFKSLNDSLGHDIGDELLKQVAQRLQASVRNEDTVARLGGDEFVILLSCRENSETMMLSHALAMTERIQAGLQVPYQLKEHIHYITPSIGITLIPDPHISPDELLKQADTAMYHAKTKGRNTISFYNEEMQRRVTQRLTIERELHLALAEQQFSLYYQPQFDADQQLVGAEALLRWLHPDKGLMATAEFIQIAEETGLTLLMGDWVIREACMQLLKWPNLPHIAINISPKQFRQPKFIQKIAHNLAEFRVAGNRLMLEITESSLTGEIDEVTEKLQTLRDMGVSLSIDNFGTGYSPLTYLRLLPINQLKVDQSFIHNINADSNDSIIVTTIIIMAKHFGLSVIAEGVETAEQMQFLRDSDCQGFQGRYFSMPLPAEDFAKQYVR